VRFAFIHTGSFSLFALLWLSLWAKMASPSGCETLSSVAQVMNVDGLTRENIASHLQKYRRLLEKKANLPSGGLIAPEHWPLMEAAQRAHLIQVCPSQQCNMLYTSGCQYVMRLFSSATNSPDKSMNFGVTSEKQLCTE
jgi:hypothetical protein